MDATDREKSNVQYVMAVQWLQPSPKNFTVQTPKNFHVTSAMSVEKPHVLSAVEQEKNPNGKRNYHERNQEPKEGNNHYRNLYCRSDTSDNTAIVVPTVSKLRSVFKAQHDLLGHHTSEMSQVRNRREDVRINSG